MCQIIFSSNNPSSSCVKLSNTSVASGIFRTLEKNMSNFEETFNFLTYVTPRGQAVWSALVKIYDLRDLSYI